MQESGGDGGGVSAEDEAHRFLGCPWVSVTNGTVLAILVNFLDVVPVGFGVLAFNLRAGLVTSLGVRDVEGILQITGRVLLRDVEGVEVPETGLDELVGGHFLETHFEEDLAEFLTDLVQGMQSAGVLVGSKSLEVVWFEVCRLPGSRGDHVGCQISLLLLNLEGELGSLLDFEAGDLLHLDKLALL